MKKRSIRDRLSRGRLLPAAAALALAVGARAATTDPAPGKKVALFVINRGGPELRSGLPAFKDAVAARTAGTGIEILTRDIVLDSAARLAGEASAEADLDTLLSRRSSVLRLARDMDADYLLAVSLLGLEREHRRVEAREIAFDNDLFRVRAAWRLLDGATGAALAGDVVEVKRVVQRNRFVEEETPDLLQGLLLEAGEKVGESVRKRFAAEKIRRPAEPARTVTFHVTAILAGVHFPRAEIDREGRVRILAEKGPVAPLAVPVELDGITIGTTGTNGPPLRAPAGIHRIRLSREDLVPFERMVYLHDGLTLDITMQLNEEGLRRWRENTRAYSELLRKTRLNDAEVEAVRGFAQKLRNSGYKVDVKVDTDEGVTVKNSQSIFKQDR